MIGRAVTVLLIALGVVLALVIVACASGRTGPAPPARTGTEADERAGASTSPAAGDPHETRRRQMVERHIAARGVSDPRVLEAMRSVPRHRFVPAALREHAHADRPLPIAAGQTISQPYIVALMTELAGTGPGERVLEVGTGSGYQAAVLAATGAEVYTIEIVPELGRQAAELLDELGYHGIHTRIGDGYRGWPEAAPFDAIVVTAAPEEIPQPLLDQLAVGGRLVIPVGRGVQELLVVSRSDDGLQRRSVAPVRFVPMTGEAQGG